MSNSKLTLASHALCWIEYARREGKKSLNSDQLADSLGSNPVTVRRVLAPVRNAGLLRTGRGRGAGWSMGQPAAETTLLDLHRALGLSGPFQLHSSPPDFNCPVGGGISKTLISVYEFAEEKMLLVLNNVTIEAMLEDILRVNQGGESLVISFVSEDLGGR